MKNGLGILGDSHLYLDTVNFIPYLTPFRRKIKIAFNLFMGEN